MVEHAVGTQDRPDVPDLPDWHDIAYLLRGSARQRRAHAALVELGILRDLAPYRATLVGTIPLAVDLPESDLDIVCRAADAAGFEDALRRLYAVRPGFQVGRVASGEGGVAVVAGFTCAGESIEVFGQDVDVEEQRGFRHMVVEARLLQLGGDRLRAAVVDLKRRGVKTEPAFAAALGLSGNPYQRLFELSRAGDAELGELVGGGRDPRGEHEEGQ